MKTTKELWKRFAQQIGIREQEIDASFSALEGKYSLPRRHYHTLDGHIKRCIELFHGVQRIAIDPVAVEAALWTHDAHYDPKAKDNEEQSILWMRSFFEKFGVRKEDLIDRIANLIAATTHRETPHGSDEKLMTDIDLAILGASKDDFDQYEIDIRSEYAWVPRPLFAEKRASILRNFLTRKAIYHHPIFQERHEQQARENLARSIEKLESIKAQG